MAFHCLYAALGQVIPDLDPLVVSGGDEIRPIGNRIKVDIIDTLVVCIHGEVGMWRADGPHFDGAIETGRCKCVCVLWVEADIHDVVCASSVYLRDKSIDGYDTKECAYLYIFPLLVPIPCFDGHVVASCEHNARGWMYGQTPDIVWMCLEGSNLVMCIVIEHAQLKVV